MEAGPCHRQVAAYWKSRRRNLTVSRARVRTVDSPAQELGFEQRVQRGGARFFVESPEPQCLVQRETQTGHLEVLCTNSIQQNIVGSELLGSVHEVAPSRGPLLVASPTDVGSRTMHAFVATMCSLAYGRDTFSCAEHSARRLTPRIAVATVRTIRATDLFARLTY